LIERGRRQFAFFICRQQSCVCLCLQQRLLFRLAQWATQMIESQRTNNRAVVFIDNEAEALAAVVKLIPAGKSRERQHGWLDASC
jgi:hypothetical protein